MKGDLFLKNAKMEEAFIQYSKALSINPESSSAISSLGDMLKMDGRFTQALQHYKESLRLNITQPMTLAQLLHTKFHCCDWDQLNDCFLRLA